MRLVLIACVGAAAVALAGCETISPEECRVADWYAIGNKNGANGQSLADLNDYAKDCAKAGVTPDRRACADGHADGLRLYCTPEEGYERGLQNAYYGGVCPPELERDFLPAYRHGREIYRVNAAIEDARRDIDDLQFRERAAQTRPERARIRDAIYDRQRDLDRFYDELDRLRRRY